MNKLVVLGAGGLAAGSIALFSAGAAGSQPDMSGYNVIGEPYVKAVQILKAQGVKATFGGSFGSALPQSQCLVDSQKVTGGRMVLMLDCSPAAAEAAKDAAGPGGPTVGSNGITTVTPTPVVPIQGAPGAVAPAPS